MVQCLHRERVLAPCGPCAGQPRSQRDRVSLAQRKQCHVAAKFHSFQLDRKGGEAESLKPHHNQEAMGSVSDSLRDNPVAAAHKPPKFLRSPVIQIGCVHVLLTRLREKHVVLFFSFYTVYIILVCTNAFSYYKSNLVQNSFFYIWIIWINYTSKTKKKPKKKPKKAQTLIWATKKDKWNNRHRAASQLPHQSSRYTSCGLKL